MRTLIRKNKLIIEVPIKLLKFGIENNPEITFKVKNSKKMIKYFKEHMLEYTTAYKEESDFFTLLDLIAIEAFESGEDWIEEPSDPDRE